MVNMSLYLTVTTFISLNVDTESKIKDLCVFRSSNQLIEPFRHWESPKKTKLMLLKTEKKGERNAFGNFGKMHRFAFIRVQPTFMVGGSLPE